jgi:DUF4097 and DUF4098 domain-containing protein YvlB
MTNKFITTTSREARALRLTALGLTMALSAVFAQAADARKEAKLDIATGGTVTIVNNTGSVVLHSDGGRQVLVAYTTHSDKVEVDENSTPDRLRMEVRTHVVPGQKPSADEARVDYEVTIPVGVSVTVSTATAPITADNLTGEISLSSDTGQVTVHNISKSHVTIRSVTAPVNLNDVTGGHVDIESSGGAVNLTNVSGHRVNVSTTSGNITYHGDCSGGGDYVLATHSGTINVILPETASVDLTARSNIGSVENDFPLKEKTHNSFVPKAGRSFAGTSNSGSSSVELRSFSGRIRVKKQ